jgi:hypothetical protein
LRTKSHANARPKAVIPGRCEASNPESRDGLLNAKQARDSGSSRIARRPE